MKSDRWQSLSLKRVVESIQSGTSVNGAPWPADGNQPGVLKTSSVYGGVFDPTENKEVDSYDLDRVSCPVLAGSLIVSRMNTKRHLGAAAAVRQDFPNLYLPDRLWAVTFCGAEPRFIDWWTKTPAYRSEVEAVCVGTSSSMQNISQGDFLGLRIELPDVETQRAIADYLDRETARIDTLIEEQQRLIDLLRERRYAVVDRAIRRGVVNARMTDSGDPLVGEVPEGWSVVHIRRVATSLDSRRIPLSSEQRAERTGPFPYYGATSVIDHIDDYIFDEPLVLVAEDGFGLLYRSKPIAVHVEGRIWVNNHAHALRPLGVPAHLLAARIESENLVPYLAGSRQPKLTAEALMGMRISIPPEDQWSQILAVLDEETAKIDTLIAETERFVELARERRSALITAAVTGQIDMREMA